MLQVKGNFSFIGGDLAKFHWLLDKKMLKSTDAIQSHRHM